MEKEILISIQLYFSYIFPIFGILFKNYLKALKNIKSVLTGEKTWIGYEYSSLNNKPQKLKQVFFHRGH